MNVLFVLAAVCYISFYPRGVEAFPTQDTSGTEINVLGQGDDNSLCASIPTSITSADDFLAKRKAAPGVCSIHEGFYHLTTRDTNDDYSCSETKPCSNGACCAKTGYCNYGPDACGTNGQSPNDKCWSNCDAHASCGQYSVTGNVTCPLNVCCSKFGFCGTTSDFCGDGCQSNCPQPPSYGSNGDVQSRIIGYYEGWNQHEKCIGMPLQDIPINGITHLHLAFASLTPQFDVIPMDGLSTQLFSDVTALKSQNPGLKVIISIGGWSFSDNGTSTQSIFPDMVSSADKRATAITKIMAFMKQFAFDGVDFDWEYPGAPDRGGTPEDGVNFTKFLYELRVALYSGDNHGIRPIVSFTAPTSYWYLQHFDLQLSAAYVDWINVMSYDLHGTWDANDPIGNQVLAHTNLTEIDEALNLFWRNDISPDRINLGLGFYGRTFQLADPACSTPGCLFKGGASPGPCTKNSGTLSYAEIQDIIQQYSLTPVYDKEAAVQYITWNNDQWASFDNQDTFQQKIKYANNLGLGGLLIWSLDLDTQDLQALTGVLYPKTISSLQSQADTANNWNDVNGGDCRGTPCGQTGCQPGEILLTSFQCDFDRLSSVCCPISSAPDPKTCSWQGTTPFCNGQCLVGQVALLSSLWGDGDLCLDGRKFYCCDVQEEAKKIDCRWGDCGSSCNADENQLTWRYQGCWGGQSPFCCKKEENWQNCGWHGEPGSCYDDHCDTGHQVELANSYEGEGEDCGWNVRSRVFCCDPPDDQSPFLPVELDYLFPNPPPIDIAHSEYKLKTDPTYGGAVSTPFANEPESAAFGFVILTSPETIQVSLDKRDGSHWDMFDCFDAVSEKEHTVRMVCSDDTPNSNCHKIHLGKGVPGTILEMPDGCGPGRYAVAVDLTLSENQTLPNHLVSRDHRAMIYDLKFDYNFARVPRDMGDTQMRVDYANTPGYWDKVVDKAATRKRKRNLDEHAGNHKRWLEEAWREDKHFSEFNEEDLNKRWFGEDIISWLKGLLNGVNSDLSVHHSYTEDFTAILLRESWSCTSGATTTTAKLDVEANVHVGINTNFGLTIIAKLGSPIDLSSSYLYFRNDGEVTARFTLDALASVNFDTGDMVLLSADKFGAAFTVPGIVTIGPNFKLLAQVEGGITASAHLEAQVNIAKWNVQQTFPDANSDWDPKSTSDIDPSGTQDVTPSNEHAFDASVTANGYLTAHLKPELVFGIEFNTNFIPIDPAAVNLVADGFVTAYASASASTSGGASFCYGVDAGAQLYATIDVPQAFKWTLPQSRFQIGPQLNFEIIPQTCPVGGNSRRDLPAYNTNYTEDIVTRDLDLRRSLQSRSLEVKSLEPRAQVYGPIFHLPSNILQCPGQSTTSSGPVNPDICNFCKTLSGGDTSTGSQKREDGDFCRVEDINPDEPWAYAPGLSSKRSLIDGLAKLWRRTTSLLVKRDDKTITWYTNVPGLSPQQQLNAGPYPVASEAEDLDKVPKYYTWSTVSTNCDGVVAQRSDTDIKNLPGRKYQTDHVYEIQTVRNFFAFLRGDDDGNGYKMPKGFKAGSDDFVTKNIAGFGPQFELGTWYKVSKCFGGSGLTNQPRLALIDGSINNQKGTFFGLENPSSKVAKVNKVIDQTQTNLQIFATGGVWSYLRNPDIWKAFKDTSLCIEQVLYDWDQDNSNWGYAQQVGRPAPGTFNGKSFQYGLRSLYTGWIDAELAAIEKNARKWQANMVTSYTNAWPTANNQNAKQVIDNIMGGTGAYSPSQMAFPRSPGSSTASVYGVWGSSTLPPPFP